MPTYIKTRAVSTEQERRDILSVAAALRAATPYLTREQRRTLRQTTDRFIEQHRRTAHTAELAALIAQRDALTA